VIPHLKKDAATGDGAVALKGEMVDEAHIKLARSILEEQKRLKHLQKEIGTQLS